MKQSVKTVIDRVFDVFFWTFLTACVLASLGSLFSCSTTLKTISSETLKVEDHTQVDTRQDSTATSIESIKENLFQQISQGCQVDILKIEYDTAKPIDSLGRQPVKAETRTKINAQRKTETAVVKESQKSDSVHVSVTDSTRNDIKMERDTEIKTVEKKRFPWPLIPIGLACVAIGALIITKIMRR